MSSIKKFRIWDRKHKRFTSDYDDVLITKDGKVLLGSGGYVNEYYEASFKKEPRFVIQQFTGLCDKNSKEIYEGDIVKYFYYNEAGRETSASFDYMGGTVAQFKEVKYDLDNFGAFYPFTLAIDSEYGIGDASPNNCEIIGNIFENPKLIK